MLARPAVRNLGLKSIMKKLESCFSQGVPEFGVVKTVFNYDQKKKVIVPVVVGTGRGPA